MEEFFEEIIRTPAGEAPPGLDLGRSREGRPVQGFRFGDGPLQVSLLAGCHADEPVGPRLLRHLVAWLASRPGDHPLLEGRSWWVIPHANPDGEVRNREWAKGDEEAYDLPRYLRHRVRELPGDDLEFGFPRGPDDEGARPEARAIQGWWQSAGGPFHLHGSLHGMGFAAGPWFLVEAAWWKRIDALVARLTGRVREMGYTLHDVERDGEKGFRRLARGFTTRPDSRAMRAHFMEREDEVTAARFRPSSMEAIRGLGGDPFTLVTEMPLFLTPGVGVTLGPPDPVAEAWKARIGRWEVRLAAVGKGREAERMAQKVRGEAESAGLHAMPIRDQMRLQWAFILAALAALAAVEARFRPPAETAGP